VTQALSLPGSYKDCLDFLYARNQFAMKLGLENINALLDRLGRPDAGGRFLHVAGTNGKGSVCANLAALLRATGSKRVGLYTSPHLVSFRERVTVDGEPIGKEWILAWLRKAMPSIEEFNATYFECVTAMALEYFRDRKCEAVVLETGLGGRLDATNAVFPALSVITSVSLDHTQILGSTVEEIWREKIAILKPGVPMVVSEGRPHLLRELREKAAALGSPVFTLADFPRNRDAESLRFQGRYATYVLPSGLRREEHQAENLCLSLLAMEILRGGPLPSAVVEPALRGARVPGRTQLLEEPGRIPVILDGAHNPGGMEALARFIREEYPGRRVTALFSVMRDKDYPQVFRSVRAFASEVLFAPLDPWYPRALPFAELAAALGPEEARALREFPLDPPAPSTQGNPVTQGRHETSGEPATHGDAAAPASVFDDLLRPGPGSADLIVVCGSLYLLGKVIPRLLPYYSALAPFRQFAGES
jgi:dihydrofolate synthase/folylpolyglutamate synthase